MRSAYSGFVYLSVYLLGLGKSTNDGANFSAYVPVVPNVVNDMLVPPMSTTLHVATPGGVFSIDP